MKTPGLVFVIFLSANTAVSQFIKQDSIIVPKKIVLALAPFEGLRFGMVAQTHRFSPFNSRFLKVPFLDETYSSIMAARTFLVDKATTITQDLHWWLELRDVKEDWMIGATLTHSPGRFMKLSWDQKNVEIWFDVAFLF